MFQAFILIIFCLNKRMPFQYKFLYTILLQEVPVILSKNIGKDKDTVLMEIPERIELAGDTGVIGRLEVDDKSEFHMHLAGKQTEIPCCNSLFNLHLWYICPNT